MAYGLDVSSSLSMLVGVTRSGGRFKLKKALPLPGFEVDITEPPSAHEHARLGSTYNGLKSLGVRPGMPLASLPGQDVYYRFSHTSGNPKLIEAQVKLEADEIAGESGRIMADYVTGCDLDYAPAIHVALAREEVVDHYASSLAAAEVQVGPLVPGCIALYHAYRVSGDRESEYVTMHANIGDDNTEIILVREGALLFARSLPIGLNAFLDRLQPEIGGDRDAIRKVLFSQVDLRPSIAAENLNEDRAISAAQEVAARVIQQISSSVMLARSALRAPKLEPRRIMLSGPGAAVPGLRELMMNRVRKTVEVFNPFANVILEGADEQTIETVKAYKPALAIALGLAVMNTDSKLERAQFLPGTVRRRREFLHKALPLYMSAAAVILLVVPLFVIASRAAAEAEDARTEFQQGPLGRYTAASNEIETYRGNLERARQRAEASLRATMPGRAATDVLLAFAERRPDSVRIRSVRLETDTSNPERDEDFQPTTRLRFEFFIERRPGADPHQVNTQLRQVLLSLPRVTNVIAGSASDEPAAQGLTVVQTVELRVGGEYVGGAQ